MSNSKQCSHNNIIPFPLRNNPQPYASKSIKFKSMPASPSLVKPSPEENRMLLQLFSHERIPSYVLADELAAQTISRVIHHAKANDTGQKKVLPSVQRDVDLMCQFKHPVGLMLQDWLDGNRHFLPDDFTSIATSSERAEEAKS